MTTKKTTDQFIEDLIDGSLIPPSQANTQQTAAEFSQLLYDQYEMTDESLQASLVKYRDRISDQLGVQLTDEQLSGLTGGKKDLSAGAIAGIGVGAGATAAVAGLGAAGVTYLAGAAVGIIIFK
jgi:alanine dehydrogenase